MYITHIHITIYPVPWYDSSWYHPSIDKYLCVDSVPQRIRFDSFPSDSKQVAVHIQVDGCRYKKQGRKKPNLGPWDACTVLYHMWSWRRITAGAARIEKKRCSADCSDSREFSSSGSRREGGGLPWGGKITAGFVHTNLSPSSQLFFIDVDILNILYIYKKFLWFCSACLLDGSWWHSINKFKTRFSMRLRARHENYSTHSFKISFM